MIGKPISSTMSIAILKAKANFEKKLLNKRKNLSTLCPDPPVRPQRGEASGEGEVQQKAKQVSAPAQQQVARNSVSQATGDRHCDST